MSRYLPCQCRVRCTGGWGQEKKKGKEERHTRKLTRACWIEFRERECNPLPLPRVRLTMNFPLFAPIDSEGRTYRGFLPVHDKEYLIQVQLGSEHEPPVVYCEPSLRRQILNGDPDKTQRRLAQCGTAIGPLLSELKQILEEADPPESVTTTSLDASSSTAAALMNELMTIGFEKIRAINDAMDGIDFALTDNKGRTHDNIHASIPPGYPLVPAKFTVHLPEQIPSSSTRLTDALNTCQMIINKYQILFDCLDELDAYTRVLDPDKPTYKDTWRRIALFNHCSLQIELQTGRPKDALKTVRFFGNDKNTKVLREKWQQSKWDPEKTPYQNITHIFGDALVPKTQGAHMDKNAAGRSVDIECGICYTYNTTRSFNVLFGNCPYCNEKITIKAIL
ncbi:WD-repeat region-domain-containing protein [Dichotomocladium elegans]|nr:WD-repeat region-domain-containing protein [Dichotomocladium elegans]